MLKNLYYLTILFFAINTCKLQAQVSAYPFSQFSSTYSPITGGQVLGNTSTDDQSFVDPAVPLGGATTGVGLPIGFNFTYNGRTYDRFAVNANGFISLGQSTATPSVNLVNTYTPISSTNTATLPLQNRIAAFARDLQSQVGGEIRYQTIGTAPARILVVQWTNYRRFASASGDNFNFQIRLLEQGGIVQVVYGNIITTSTTTATVQAGLRGDANTDFNNRQTTSNWAATTAGTLNSATCTFSSTIRPTSGYTFQWGLIINDDAGVAGITSPAVPLTPGNQAVNVILNNFGGNTVNTVNLEWSAAGVFQGTTAYSTPLAAGANTNVNLGNYNFPNNPTLYKFWTSLPNGVVDNRQSNDTFQITLCGGLAGGTYTVGTPTSNFPTINDMMTALYSCGITGPVTMNIQPGTYTGSIRFIGPILGASSVNTVTINGAGQGQTIITHNATGVNGNATIAMDGVRFLTIQNMTIRNTGTNLAWGVLMTNSANNNSLLNNSIEMYYAPNVISVYGVAFQGAYASAGTEGNNANYNTVQGNTVTGGDQAFRIEGATGAANKGNRFLNNTIFGVDDYAFYMDDQDSIEIIGNNIYDLRSVTNYGMYIFDFTSFIISNNKVDARSYGIYAFNMGSAGVITRRNQIINNMVRFEVTYGMYISNVRSTDFYHNTVFGYGTSLTNATVYLLTPNDVNFKNNILVNNSGYVFRSGSANALASMNYNLMYQPNPNTNFVSFGTNVYNNFSQWQTNTFGHGANDVYGDPVFASATDLHVEGLLANDAGDNAVAVNSDIDGDSRPFPLATRVDIGADEFRPRFNDAGVLALVSPAVPLQFGFRPVTVTVKNFGNSNLNIFTVQWRYNGIQQGNYTYTGSPVAPQQTVNVTLGSINFPAGINANMEFWTINPNNVADERLSNDTLNVSLCAGLNGSYTLGNPGSNYPTFADAINELYQCGVSGPVTFLVQNGTYTGQQLALTGVIPGSSNINRISFQGVNASTVILTHDGTQNKIPTILLDGVDYVTVRNMTINTTAPTGARGHGIHLINQADFIQIVDNVINSTYASGINDMIGIVASNVINDDYAEGNTANQLLIQGNTINGGEMGIHLEGSALLSKIRNISIINNTISGYDDYGVYVDEIDSFYFERNTITSLSGSTIASGMYSYDCTNFSIQRNKIHVRDYGIYLYNGNNPFSSSRGKFYNNMIVSSEDDALYSGFTGSTDFWHNTFVARSFANASANGVYLLSPIAGTNDFRNNIFLTNSSSTTSYAFESSVNTAQLRMDNNLFFSVGINTIRYGTTNYTFANWRTTNPYGYDQNSLNVNPLFVNLNTADLHINNASLNATGDSTVAVLIDYDGQNRPSVGSTRPDIGADEIVVLNNDAIAIGVSAPAAFSCENANQSVDVIIGNNGLANLTVANVTVNVTGPLTTSFTQAYNGNLISGQTATLTMGNINTTGGGQFCFQVITTMVGDLNTVNDTVLVCQTILPAIPSLVADTTCPNQSASLTSSPAGGISWYNVPAGGVALSTSDTFNTGPIVFSTTYYAEVTACGSTRYPVTATVVIPTPFSLGNDTLICATGFANFSGPTNNIASYLWSSGETTQSIAAQNAGTYTLSITDIYGCLRSDVVEVFNYPVLNSSATASTLTCGNAGTGQIDLTVAGTAPFTYTWSTGDTTEDLTNLNVGTYQVSITDNNACVYVESYSVFGPSAISFSSVQTFSQSCGILPDGVINVSVTGGAQPYTYLWDNGSTTEDLSALTNGSYTITVTDATGCTTSISTALNISSTVAINVLNVTDESVQLGGAIDISVSGGQAPYYILWNTGYTTASVSGLVAGTYTVTVVDVNGCPAVDTIQVGYSIPTSISSLDDVQCQIFPNPTQGLVQVQLQFTKPTEVLLELFSMDGRKLQTLSSLYTTTQNYSIDLSEYPAAVYQIRMIIGDQTISKKIILTR